jgi:hypothetical protein
MCHSQQRCAKKSWPSRDEVASGTLIMTETWEKNYQYNSHVSGQNKNSVIYGNAFKLLHSLRTKDSRNVKQAKVPRLRRVWQVFSYILSKSQFISLITLQIKLGNYKRCLLTIPYITIALFHASPYRLGRTHKFPRISQNSYQQTDTKTHGVLSTTKTKNN